MLAKISGWTKLAKVYHCTEKFQGERWSLESAMLNSARYKSCLVVGANPDGLYLLPILPFRYGHQPLFIPWVDISVKPVKSLFLWSTELRFQQAPRTSLKIGPGLTSRIAKAAAENWPAFNLAQD